MKKKIILGLVIFTCLLFAGMNFALADVGDVSLTVFTSRGCPHCSAEVEFLGSLQTEYPNLDIMALEVSKNADNAKLFQDVGRELGISTGSVPLTIVGDKYLAGFGENIIGPKIRTLVEECQSGKCPNVIGELVEENDYALKELALETSSKEMTPSEKNTESSDSAEVSVPVLGNIDAKNVSIVLVTVVLAAVDGFNPCAMWVLLFLITLLLGLKDRRKMWFLGIVFLIASAFVYFLFLTAWLNIFLFIGSLFWVKLIVAGVAIFGGIYSLRDFFVNKESGCKVTNQKQKSKIAGYFQKIIHSKTLWFSALGLIALAFIVNLIELACSAGLPAIFSSILVQNELPTYQYYLYLLLYVAIFLLDDIIIFSLAMMMLKVTGISTKYRRISSLIGGIIMLFIGLAIIFFPELLVFG